MDLETDVAWISLGSNVGHRGAALAGLREGLQREDVVIEAASSEVLTRPVGVTGQEDFHNQVVRVRSPQSWTPEHWLRHCQKAEALAGRRPTYRWGPRVADADVLLLGLHGEIAVHTSDLQVPHRELVNRPFLARLLGEIGYAKSASGRPAAGST